MATFLAPECIALHLPALKMRFVSNVSLPCPLCYLPFWQFMPCADLINHSAVAASEPSLLSDLVLVSAKSHQKHSTQQGFHFAGYFVRSLVSFTTYLKSTSFTWDIANFFIETSGTIFSNAMWMKFYLQIEVITSNNSVKGHSGIRTLFLPE